MAGKVSEPKRGRSEKLRGVGQRAGDVAHLDELDDLGKSLLGKRRELVLNQSPGAV